MRTASFLFLCASLILVVLFAPALAAQVAEGQSSENTVEGTVVSTSAETLVVRTDDNDFRLFILDRTTTRPNAIIQGTRVRVRSTVGDRGARLATEVNALGSRPNTATGTETQAKPVPPAVKNVEQEIKREARRWHLGVRAGAALDPELFMFGVHSQIGPVFNRNVFLRPNAEFAFGEVTDLIALNLEAIYRFPISTRGKDFSAYLGAGPGFTFIHQNFERTQGQGRDIDFGDFNYQTGFNILTGVQRRHTFFEIKTSLYSRPAPTVRLILGYNF
jgi:opacity protein-like surface antigen